VVIADLEVEKARGVCDEVRALGVSAAVHELDISDVPATRALVDSTVDRHGRLDILVNNAANRQGPSFYEVSEQQWDRFFDVNARGTFFLMQAAGRRMADAGWGRVINIASIAARGWWGAPCPPYSGSKMAIIAMSRIAAMALGPHNVTVNTVCPGLTRTAIYLGMAARRADQDGVSAQEGLARVDGERGIPIGRSNEPSDIASCVAFLASEDARNITGQTFNVDGGLVFESGVSQPSDYARSATVPLRSN
jgi:NAD(P)-dependent dehydrogenase (short-subunit alcohol dehydrogenase family)